MQLSPKQKIIIGINYFIGLVIAAKYTMLIDLYAMHNHFDEWLKLVFLLFFTTAIVGTPLFCISCILDHSKINSYTEESLFTLRSGLDAIGVATAYTMLLYLLGFTDTFFSFVTLYKL